MKTSQGGTQMYGPYCGRVRVCKAVSPSEYGESSERQLYMLEHEDIHWFRRGRFCLSCNETFLTAEVNKDFLYEELKSALAVVKSDAEKYIKESKLASKTLNKFVKSLDKLRALRVYDDM